MPMETGPLARFVVGLGAKKEEYWDITNRCLKKLDLPINALYSTIGRILARSMEANLLSKWQKEFYIQLVQNIKSGDERMFNGVYWEPNSWPHSA
ncbi:MAG: nickel-dependent hydrogenase large subunit, partial [Bacteroidales bacterium]